MKKPIRTTRSSFLLVLLVVFSFSSNAQVPVYDINGTRNQQQSPQLAQAQTQQQAPVNSASSSNNDGNDIVVNLYLQLEQLQQEVQNLRGIVEEQSYQLRQMQTEQRDRYLDLDRRLSELSGAGQQSTTITGAGIANGVANTEPFIEPPALQSDLDAAPVSPGGVTPDITRSNTSPDRSAIPAGAVATGATPTPPVTAQSEQDMYRNALNLLLEQSRYDEAIAGFGRYIDAYPSGRYLANAYYWQGEALILAQRFPQAESVFRKVLDDFPADPKAADAMLKLGVVYSQTGNTARARETWQGISSRYPESLNAIRAAEDYLSRL